MAALSLEFTIKEKNLLCVIGYALADFINFLNPSTAWLRGRSGAEKGACGVIGLIRTKTREGENAESGVGPEKEQECEL